MPQTATARPIAAVPERVYSDPSELIADVIASKHVTGPGQMDAKARLREYATETGGGAELTAPAGVNMAGFVMPAWTEPELDVRVPASVYAAIGPRPLPEHGMTLVAPRVTTGASAAKQDDEGDDASKTDLVADLAEIDVLTAASEVEVTLQGYERGMIGEAAVAELDAAVTEDIDSQIIAATLAGTYTAAAVNVTSGNKGYDKLWALIAGAKRAVHDNLKRRPRHVVMAPRRWEVFDKQVGPDGPFLGSAWDFQGMMPVVTAAMPEDLGSSTNQDAVIVADLMQHRLYAGPLTVTVDVQSDGSKLTVKLVGWRYWAHSPEVRPEATILLTGAGLT